MAKVISTPRKPATRRTRPKLVHQCLIVLTGIDPLVWRRIQVPGAYSFWDLHVAIQDAMGWLDYHLHEFRLLDADEQRLVSIGIPTDDDPEDRPVIAGWEVPLSRFFEKRGWHAPHASYTYDFGDDWEHVLVHEGMESADSSLRYPRCVSGTRRCPPDAGRRPSNDKAGDALCLGSRGLLRAGFQRCGHDFKRSSTSRAPCKTAITVRGELAGSYTTRYE